MKRLALAVAFAALVPSIALADVREGQRAVAFTLPLVDGSSVSMRQFAGKAVYLNFFATWCEPSTNEMSALMRLAKQYAGTVSILGVDESEDPARTKPFFAAHHLSYPVLLDRDGLLGKTYGAIGLPTHVFIDRHGVVRRVMPGELTPAKIEAELKALR